MKHIPQRLAPILGVCLLLATLGCQKAAQQSQANEAEAKPEQSMSTPQSTSGGATTDEEAGGTVTESQDLSEREAEVAKREEAVAQREAAVATKERMAAPKPRSPKSQPPAVPSGSQPEATQPAQTAAAAASAENESWRERRSEREVTVQVPAGTTFDIEMADTLSSETAQVGDRFSARTVKDLTQAGEVALPAGSRVEGEVASVQALKKIGGQAQLVLRFDHVVLPDGQSIPLQASFAAAGKSETGRDAGTIAGSTAAGAILGRIIDKRHRDKNTVLGALVGAAVGTAIASKTKGEPVELPAGAVVTLSLDQSLSVTRRVPVG